MSLRAQMQGYLSHKYRGTSLVQGYLAQIQGYLAHNFLGSSLLPARTFHLQGNRKHIETHPNRTLPKANA